jgi:hypothetical protein
MIASKNSIKTFLNDKKGQELGPSTLLLLLILFAAGTAVMLIIMGKWLDLTGYRYKIETQRNAMNLVQLIVSNSPVVKKITDQPDKLILDADKLDNYEEYAKIGWSPSEMTPERENYRKSWEDCCDFLDFDHNFTVHDIVTGENWTIGNLVFKEMSECYPQRVMGYADLPVIISKNNENHHGVAVVRLMKTSLSDLSFWLSEAFMMAYWKDYWDLFPELTDYAVTIPLDPEIKKVSIHDVDDNNKRICTHLDNIVVCKNFVYKQTTSTGDTIGFKKDPIPYTGDCMKVTITVTKDTSLCSGGEKCVIIVYPGG